LGQVFHELADREPRLLQELVGHADPEAFLALQEHFQQGDGIQSGFPQCPVVR
jgi:hypothetical protein